MNGLGFDYLLLAWVMISTLAIGIAICARVTRLTGVALIGYGTAAGVAVHGLFGLLSALHWPTRHLFAVLPLICASVAVVDLTRGRRWLRICEGVNRTLGMSLLLWLLFIVLCVGITRAEVRWPGALPDGIYVFKEHRLNTKVQYLTGLPADNYIPYTVTEFLLRGIPFGQHHPILPGNEVSNRTILMSLVALPFRTLLTWRTEWDHGLGEFTYVGQTWPDVGSLNADDSFGEFLIVGIFLNSLLLLGLLVLFERWAAPAAVPIAVLVFITNPYFIAQTIFTWPKAMAGFFILLAWNSMRRAHSGLVVGACAVLAYHSHPSSIVAAISIGLWLALRSWRERTGVRPVVAYAAMFVLGALPGLIWTKLVLALPSDMMWQNFAGAGTEAAFAAPVNFVWIRVVNAFNTFAPVALAVYPFQLQTVLSYTSADLPFAIGLLLMIPSFRAGEELASTERMFVAFAFAVPAAVILLLYSCPAAPILHGWQPIIGALLFLAVLRLRRTLTPRRFAAVILLQIACNLGLLWMRASATGAHWAGN